MEVKVTSGNREVICSGSAIVVHGSYLEFAIRTLRFRLSFDYRDNEGRSYFQPIINSDNPSETFLEIRGYNFDNTVLNTLSEPISLAQHDGRNLSIGITVSSVNRRNNPENEEEQIEDKLVSYTWYLDLPQNNNQQPVSV